MLQSSREAIGISSHAGSPQSSKLEVTPSVRKVRVRRVGHSLNRPNQPKKITPPKCGSTRRVSRDLRKRKRRVPVGQMQLGFKEGEAELPRFWLPRFYDFNVHSAKKIAS